MKEYWKRIIDEELVLRLEVFGTVRNHSIFRLDISC